MQHEFPYIIIQSRDNNVHGSFYLALEHETNAVIHNARFYRYFFKC